MTTEHWVMRPASDLATLRCALLQTIQTTAVRLRLKSLFMAGIHPYALMAISKEIFYENLWNINCADISNFHSFKKIKETERLR